MRLSTETSTLHLTRYWTWEIKRNGESAQKHTARKKREVMAASASETKGWEEMGHHKDTERKHTQTLPKILDLVTTIFSLPKVYFYHFSECVSAWGSVNVSPGTFMGHRYWISWSWSSRLWAAQCGCWESNKYSSRAARTPSASLSKYLV